MMLCSRNARLRFVFRFNFLILFLFFSFTCIAVRSQHLNIDHSAVLFKYFGNCRSVGSITITFIKIIVVPVVWIEPSWPISFLLTPTTAYHTSVISYHESAPTSSLFCQWLHSSDSTHHNVPCTNIKFGEQAFCVSGPLHWNCLTGTICATADPVLFNNNLETYYLNLHFN